MGGAAWLAGHRVLAARLTVSFRRLLPLGTVALLAARVGEVDGRKVRVTAELTNEAGEAFCTAEGLFIEMDERRHAEVGHDGLPTSDAILEFEHLWIVEGSDLVGSMPDQQRRRRG